MICTDRPRLLETAAGVLGFRDGSELLAAHTEHPYNTAFATAGHRSAAEAYALRGVGRHTGPVGVMSSMLAPRPVLAFCDRCIRADDNRGSVHAWRRAHQLPGTFVCHLHGEPLRTTTIRRAGRVGKRAYVALTDDVVRDAWSAPRYARSTGRVLLRYAQNGARLLQSGEPPDIPVLQGRLRGLLGDFRWERAGSLVAMSRLAPALLNHPNVAPLLQAMDTRWSVSTCATALNALLYRNGTSKHPLLVLMLLETVGASLDELLGDREPAVSDHPRREGETGPAVVDLCANPACNAARPREVEALLRDATSLRAACSRCGFEVRAPAGRCRRPVVSRTCASWDAAIGAALSDPDISMRAVSREFSASAGSIMRAARRAGAWRTEWNDRPKLMDRAAARRDRLVVDHRSAWSHHVSGESSGASTKDLPRPAFNAYRWLLRNDREWLAANGGPGPGRWGHRASGPASGRQSGDDTT